ncbi:methyltransferase-like protein 23 isoform X2 [Cyclopterus lumpus]|uniref:methyltransferase-like protein 23 isoform X2 n=1 Tax=Cyclopterus lumpus TaxID=8103 RepID=UPI0014865ACE|nr:methyltransferase-like protein 23 isoform X2 [Cyclopterus lumpus]
MEPGGAEPPSKVFTFKDDQRSPPVCLSVSIPEVLDPHYGMYVWPCAVVLAQYLWTRRETLRGKKVLELGAGVSLPGVVAARCGAQVTLSDGAKTPLCLDNCRRSCEANGLLDVGVLSLTWGEVSPELLLLPELDIILGSDVFYEPQGSNPAIRQPASESQRGRLHQTGPSDEDDGDIGGRTEGQEQHHLRQADQPGGGGGLCRPVHQPEGVHHGPSSL